ncbi:alpha-L-fucosidase [Luteolibacter ambystomatis]|uniref:alpha-L-fucosidase n=1 Tax=Luteolibacter ambystomatis TaxID=2824561 RepID=A0A975J305_9BACT|nr:alpha-L-fucosidase [Luteolibacter ambystomatis]QUE53115.1 alpha-L-fucosidase [Luteolibacter ambystomatis]
MHPFAFQKWRILAAASLLLAAGAAAHAAPAPTTTIPVTKDDPRKAWWRDAKFGMFVHWGVYAVPAGVHDGRPVRHLGEWIMCHGRISREDYRKYAERLAPDGYQPGTWVDLAEQAGMKYIVVTAKHHDGFALFDSKVSDWDAVDATPRKQDLLMPLVEECRKRNMPLGYHYSQAQDWYHPGGGTYGQPWDESQKGSFDDYLAKIAVPQIKELSERYGPIACIFFDTPVGMNASRAAAVRAAVPPSTLINDRLSPGTPADFRSYENALPRELIPAGDWELCLSCNDTWGYKSNDQHWKSGASLIRLLSETSSRGGNMLLNVGPEADGRIPDAAASTLREIGGWLRVNGEAIYGTTRSPFLPIPWNGGCTQKTLPSGDTAIYAHLYEQPKDGKVLLPGLTNAIVSAELLAGGRKVPFTRSGNSWSLDLPSDATASPVRIVKVVVKGAPVIEERALEPDADGRMTLGVSIARLQGTKIRLERQPSTIEQNIGFWTEVADTAEWNIQPAATADYGTTWDIACAADSSGSILAIVQGDKELGRFEIPSTGSWNEFQTVAGPTLKLTAGASKLRLVPVSKPGLGVVNLRSLTLAKTR